MNLNIFFRSFPDTKFKYNYLMMSNDSDKAHIKTIFENMSQLFFLNYCFFILSFKVLLESHARCHTEFVKSRLPLKKKFIKVPT